MFSKLVFAVLAIQALFVCADPNPTVPGPGDVYKEGATCTTDWNVDTTGTWTKMTIQLMTGDNFNMVSLANLATVDATKQSSYTFTCPQVTPHSAIYFYQFTSPSSSNTYWTTRFAIVDASGVITPPSNSTQSNGAQIPWGIGAIVGGSPASSPSASASGTFTTVISPASSPGVTSASLPSSSSSVSSPPGQSNFISVTTVVGSSSAPNPSTTSTVTTNSASSMLSRQAGVVAVVIVTAAFMTIF